MPKVTLKQLRTAYDKAVDIHKNHLASDGVKLPRWGTTKGYWLAVLMHYSPDFVHKDDMSQIVRAYIPQAGTDQQVRHLVRDGWNLEGDRKGSHKITDPYSAHSQYTRQLLRSKNLLLAGDFEGIKSAFGNKCATCGAIEGQPDPRYGGDKVKLQKGHRDPEKAMEKGNVIPQCQFCNRSYKDDFTFDDKGRVRAVASPKPVLRASKKVKADVMLALKKENKKKPKS